MNLKLIRKDFTDKSTIGELYVDNQFECYVLEDAVRETKLAGITAIPYGTYLVTITYSNRFGKDMPLLNNVPNFSGVRIHSGNTDKDTEGCLLVGTGKGVNIITQSKLAFDKLFPKLKEAKDEIRIEIIKDQRKSGQ